MSWNDICARLIHVPWPKQPRSSDFVFLPPLIFDHLDKFDVGHSGKLFDMAAFDLDQGSNDLERLDGFNLGFQHRQCHRFLQR